MLGRLIARNRYFLLPDRFSDNQENEFFDNNGDKVSNGKAAPYQSSDRGNALEGTQSWLDAKAKFCGGTLKGVISKVGYLRHVGITALWIGPIFKQVAALETYHGYGVQNFMNVDPRFGTPQDVLELVKQSHAMGIYIILDIITNHSGNVFEYDEPNKSPVYDNGQIYPIKGFYRQSRPSFRANKSKQIPKSIPR
jgi:glycosidase